MSNKDSERWKNLMLYNAYATDEEMEPIMIVGGIILLLVGVGFLIHWLITTITG